RALVRALGGTVNGERATDVRVESSGIEGVVSGRRIRVGSPAVVRRSAGPASLADVEARIIAAGLTTVLVPVDGQIVAAAGMGDPIRPDAAEAVRALRQVGYRVGILSGDHPDLVAAVGRSLGLDDRDVRGGVSPEQKLAVVQQTAASGPVVMVG